MRLDVRFLVPGLPFDPNAPLAKDLGGSETAGIQLATAVAALGHTVTVFCNVPRPGMAEKVAYVPIDQFLPICQGVPFDLLVVQRLPEQFGYRYASKVNVLWVHDMLEARRNSAVVGTAHAVDRIATVSGFHARQWREACPDLPENLFLELRNGIDLDLVHQARDAGPKERDLNRIIFAARPERGLDVMLQAVWPELLRRMPDLKLEIAGYGCPAPHLDGFYQQLRHLAGQLPNVTWLPPMPKAELYRRYWTAGAYLYPTPSPMIPNFREVSCISAMEAMACGLPFIAPDVGALRETTGAAGVLVPFRADRGMSAAHPEVVSALVEATVRTLSDREQWKHASEQGKARARALGWQPVATRLVDEALAIMRSESADPYRLAKHFYRRQDIVAAQRVCREHAALVETGRAEPDSRVSELAERLKRDYAHARDPEALAAFYDSSVGPTNGHVFDGLMASPPERFTTAPFLRYAQIRDVIAQRLPKARQGEPFAILDWGCAQGECSAVLANSFPLASIVGVDASSDEIARARRLVEAKVSRDPSRVTFLDGCDETTPASESLPPALVGPFDVVVLGEVLEHLIDPVLFVQRIEQLIGPGGIVVVTVPFGPWEASKWRNPTRQHLREFEAADLQDIFGVRTGLIVDRQPAALCQTTGEALGYSIVSFEADSSTPLGEIDWSRKSTVQRPRQTLSACMMVGGEKSTSTLDWCLESLHPAVDEIVIADTGMEERAREIAARHEAVLFSAPSPLDPKVGFETPRNQALDRCRMDWVLMIDADEKLVSPLTIWRYLRESPIHCFATRQHHFAIDAQWKPDMPGRLFRRRPEPKSGKPMRFWGKLHEHAELGVNEGTGFTIVVTDVNIAHVGYLDNLTRMERFDRNLPLLEADATAYPDRKLMKLVVMRDSIIKARDALAKMGINPMETGAARALAYATQLCQDVIRIFREVFRDDASMMSDEAMNHYHDACQLLGTEYSGTLDLQIARGNPASNHRFFESIEDIERIFQARVKNAREVFGNRWW